MKGVKLIFCVLAVFVIATACAVRQETTVTPSKPVSIVDKEPTTTPKVTPPAPVAKPKDIAPEVQKLVDAAKTKVQSLKYNYKGPETNKFLYPVLVKGQKMKYEIVSLSRSYNAEGDYNHVFIDTSSKLAEAYCLDTCQYKGKKAELAYDNAYLKTPLDWLFEMNSAKKVGEEVIESRKTFKVEADNGILWIDTFYGLPLKVISGENEYQFSQLAVNSVEDADVLP